MRQTQFNIYKAIQTTKEIESKRTAASVAKNITSRRASRKTKVSNLRMQNFPSFPFCSCAVVVVIQRRCCNNLMAVQVNKYCQSPRQPAAMLYKSAVPASVPVQLVHNITRRNGGNSVHGHTQCKQRMMNFTKISQYQYNSLFAES